MLSKKAKELTNGSSLIRAMFSEGAKLIKEYGEENVFDFSIGNPSAPPPKEVEESIVKILKEQKPSNVHGYMNNAGYPEVREKIANSLNKKFNTNYNENNIVMTVGAAGGLNVLLKTLLDPQDEVIVLAPFFAEYKNYIDINGGKMIIVDAIEGFKLNIKGIEEAITSKTKAIIINSPNNPTGVVYSEEEIIALSNVLQHKQKELSKDIYIISDEPYREIVYNNTKVPFIPNYYKNTFVGYSYSKSLSLPGERIGYIIIGDMEHKEDMLAGLSLINRILGFVNAPSLFQKVIGECVDVQIDISSYEENYTLLYNELVKMGFDCTEASGTFYLFIKTPNGVDDLQFCEKAKEYNILLVPGRAFFAENYVRLSYCTTLDKIIKSLPSFQKLADFYFKN